ncbi:hypothetical protein [Pseudoduganella sp. HUAS MS19]
MAKLGCTCGHVIRDQTDSIPYKASLLRDVDYNPFFDWLSDETQSFVEAVQRGAIDAWLLERGYGPDYVSLNLPYGHILHDHIHSQYIEYSRDLFQCTNCGRLLIETSESNKFAGFAPDDPSEKNLLGDALNTPSCKDPTMHPGGLATDPEPET